MGTSVSAASGSPWLQARRRPVTSTLRAGGTLESLLFAICRKRTDLPLQKQPRRFVTISGAKPRVTSSKAGDPLRRTPEGGSMKRISLVTLLSLVAAVAATEPSAPSRHAAAKHLFVWAGDQARQAPDFLAVVDFDERSSDYGRVVATVPLAEPGASGNEPHHVGLSRNGKVLAA